MMQLFYKNAKDCAAESDKLYGMAFAWMLASEGDAANLATEHTQLILTYCQQVMSGKLDDKTVASVLNLLSDKVTDSGGHALLPDETNDFSASLIDSIDADADDQIADADEIFYGSTLARALLAECPELCHDPSVYAVAAFNPRMVLPPYAKLNTLAGVERAEYVRDMRRAKYESKRYQQHRDGLHRLMQKILAYTDAELIKLRANDSTITRMKLIALDRKAAYDQERLKADFARHPAIQIIQQNRAANKAYYDAEVERRCAETGNDADNRIDDAGHAEVAKITSVSQLFATSTSAVKRVMTSQMATNTNDDANQGDDDTTSMRSAVTVVTPRQRYGPPSDSAVANRKREQIQFSPAKRTLPNTQSTVRQENYSKMSRSANMEDRRSSKTSSLANSAGADNQRRSDYERMPMQTKYYGGTPTQPYNTSMPRANVHSRLSRRRSPSREAEEHYSFRRSGKRGRDDRAADRSNDDKYRRRQ